MSGNERKRMTVMAGVAAGELTLVQAAELMAVSYRQSKRIWKRYQADGDAGLVHRLRGKPSARRKPAALRAQALARYAEERYADFRAFGTDDCAQTENHDPKIRSNRRSNG